MACREHESSIYKRTAFLLCCIAVKLGILSSCAEKRVEVAWNNDFSKIFNAYWNESVKPLQYYCSSSCIRLVTHEENVILEENAV